MNIESSGWSGSSPSSNIYDEAMASIDPSWLKDSEEILVGYLEHTTNDNTEKSSVRIHNANGRKSTTHLSLTKNLSNTYQENHTRDIT
jgi:hypothetical protein